MSRDSTVLLDKPAPDSTDPLTGVSSRALLHIRLEEELARGLGQSRVFSLLMLDLDYFKSINDAFGHARGDQALVEVARRIRRSIRKTDEIYRYSGDEFVLLLPETSMSQAVRLAKRILRAIGGAPLAGDLPVTLSVSIGVSSFPADGASVAALFDVIDRRHYRSKADGRGRVTWRDAEPPAVGLLAPPERLIERDAQLRRLKDFLDQLPAERRGAFQVGGAPGAGGSRFLEEARKLARLMGYCVLALSGQHGLRARVYGALAEAQQAWYGWPAPITSPDALAAALQQHMAAKGLRGLLIAVDQVGLLDQGSLDVVGALLGSRLPEAVGLVYIAAADPAPLPIPELGLHEHVTLEPLSRKGVQIWLRQALRWEPPAPFTGWFYQQTGGFPGLVARGLSAVVAQGALRATPDGWELRAGFEQLAIAGASVEPPGNLPPAMPDFVGRAEELRALKRAIGERQIITLVGPGGIGKSRLALQLAAECRARFADGVYLIDLAAITSASLIVAAIGAAVGLRFSPAGDAREQLIAYLRPRRMLLVLDTFEHLLDGAPLLAALAAQAPELRLLVTSIARLNLSGEATVEVQGLTLPDEETLAGAPRGTALDLFLHTARAARPDFTPSGEDWRWIARICRIVDGRPLGIEMAAAWVTSFSCETIARHIERSLESLAPPSAGRPEGRHSLRAVFDAFWEILSPSEQQTIANLAVFQGDATRDAFRQIAGVSPFFLDALVAKMVLRVTPRQRYAPHALLRSYAAGKLAADEAREEAAYARHASYYLEALRRHAEEFNGEQQHAALDALGLEIAEIRAAWAYAATRGWVEEIDRTLASLAAFLSSRGWFQEGLSLLRLTADQLRARGGDGAEAGLALCRARVLSRLGQFHHHVGSYAQGSAAIEEALALLAPERYPQDAAEAMYHLAAIRIASGRYAEARGLLRRSLALARQLENLGLTFWVLSRLGIAVWRENDLAGAIEVLEQAWSIARRMSDPGKVAVSLCNLGDALHERGDHARAERLLLEGLAACQSTGAPALEGSILDSLGKNAAAAGDPAGSARYFRMALQVVQAIEAAPLAYEILTSVAELWAGQGCRGKASALADVVERGEGTREDTRIRAGRLLAALTLGEATAPSDEDRARWREAPLSDLLAEVAGLLGERASFG